MTDLLLFAPQVKEYLLVLGSASSQHPSSWTDLFLVEIWIWIIQNSVHDPSQQSPLSCNLTGNPICSSVQCYAHNLVWLFALDHDPRATRGHHKHTQTVTAWVFRFSVRMFSPVLGYLCFVFVHCGYMYSFQLICYTLTQVLASLRAAYYLFTAPVLSLNFTLKVKAFHEFFRT